MPGISANSCINSSHPSFGVPDRMSRLPPPDGPVKNVIFQAFIHLQDAPKQKPTLSITPVKKLQIFFCLSFSKRHPNQISNKLLQRSRAQNLWDRMLHGIRAPVRAFSAGMDNQSLGPSLKGRGFFLSSLSIKKQKKPPNCTHQCALQMSAASSPNSCTTKTHFPQPLFCHPKSPGFVALNHLDSLFSFRLTFPSHLDLSEVRPVRAESGVPR